MPHGRPALPRLALALPALVVASGCGPTDQEAAGAVLMSLPLAIAVGHLFVRLLTWLWRPLVDPPLSARPALVAAAFALVPAAAVAITIGDGVLEWVPAAAWLYGTTYLTLLFVVWRIWLACDPQSAGSWSFFAPLSMTVLPGIPLLFGDGGQFGEVVVAGWILVGYGGMVGGPILVILVVEALVRRRARRPATK